MFSIYLKLVDVFHPDGTQAAMNELGRIVVKLPLPPGNMSTLYRNDELFKKTYFQRFPVSLIIIIFCSGLLSISK